DPHQMVAHDAAHGLAGPIVAVELGEKALLVVAQALDVERRGQLLLAPEMMINAANAGARAHPDIGERRAGKSNRREAVQGGGEDIPPARVRLRVPPPRRDRLARAA